MTTKKKVESIEPPEATEEVVVEEAENTPKEVAPAKSQAERDLDTLIEAWKIRQNSERYKAAKAIAGSRMID